MNTIATLAIAKERWESFKRMWDLHPFKFSPLKGTSVEGEEKEWPIAGWGGRFLTHARGCSFRAVHYT